MPSIEVAEDQILDSLKQLSSRGRREAIRRLLPTADYLEHAVETHRPRLEAIARQRGLDFNRLR